MPKPILRRSVKFDTSSFNAEGRTVSLVISTETPYLRMFGNEILGHSAENIRTERLDAPAPLLVNHNTEDYPIGVLVSYELVEGTLRGVVRFAKTEEGEKVMQLVADGIMGQSSVGYFVEDLEVIGETEDGVPNVLVKSWTPYEISIVTIAADVNAGVGRDMDEIQARVTRSLEAFKTNKPIDAASTDTPAEGSPANAQAADGATQELERVTALKALGGALDAETYAQRCIDENKTVDEFKAGVDAFKREMSAATKNKTKTKGREEMSFTAQLNAALRIMLTGKSKSEMPEAIRAMDADIRANSGNAAIAATRGATEGIALPLAHLLQLNRDYNVGTPEKGGLVTESVLRGDLLLEALYPKNVLTDLGVQIWTLDSAIEIPRQSAVAGVVYGYGEKAVATGQDEYEFSMLNLKPHRIAAYQGVTNQMILQQSFDIVGLMQRQLFTKFGLEQQKMVFGNGGTNQPTGLGGASINAVVGASYAAGNIREKMIDMITSISAKEGTGTKFYMNDITYWKMKQIKLDTGSGKFLLDDGTFEGFPVVRSNAIANNVVYFADWNQVILALFSSVNFTWEPNVKGGYKDLVLEAFHDTNVLRGDWITKMVIGA